MKQGAAIYFREEQVGEVFRRLYDSEINVEFYSFWDTGYDFRVGDTANGFAEYTVSFLPEMAEWDGVRRDVSLLAFSVVSIYPESDFAAWYRLEQRSGGLADGVTRRALFQIAGVMLYEEIIVKTGWGKPLTATSRYCWEDGTTFELSPTGSSGGGVLEFANKEQEK